MPFFVPMVQSKENVGVFFRHLDGIHEPAQVVNELRCWFVTMVDGVVDDFPQSFGVNDRTRVAVRYDRILPCLDESSMGIVQVSECDRGNSHRSTVRACTPIVEVIVTTAFEPKKIPTPIDGASVCRFRCRRYRRTSAAGIGEPI